jgi:TPR repeat protein
MKALRVLLILPALLLFSFSVAAQENLPASYLQRLATVDRLLKLTPAEFADLKSRAQAGEAEAQYQLAFVCGVGRITPRDKAESQRWMLKSAEQGYVPAETSMGASYLDNHIRGPAPNYAESERWLRLASEQGDAEAQLWLGIGFDRGYFGRTDYKESLQWLRKSADQGLPDAQYALAEMYEEGHGVPRSDEAAASWLRRAADHYSDVDGVFQAETHLAYMYRDGRVKENNVEAYKWFAIVGAAVNPPTDEDVKHVSKEMSVAQIAEAQQKIREWVEGHPVRPR